MSEDEVPQLGGADHPTPGQLVRACAALAIRFERASIKISGVRPMRSAGNLYTVRAELAQEKIELEAVGRLRHHISREHWSAAISVSPEGNLVVDLTAYGDVVQALARTYP